MQANKEVKKLYYSIGEVSEITALKQYVLRYWETEFSQLKPSKNSAGNRNYRKSDIDLILDIKDLFYKKLKNTNIDVGAQNCHENESYGAYTGSINSKMIKIIYKNIIKLIQK